MAFSFCEDITFPKFLSSVVGRFPERTAIEDSSGSYSYAELDRRTRDLAAGFSSVGIRRGDHVCVWAELWVDTAVTYYALMRLGATAVMMRTTTPESTVAAIADKGDCTFAICGSEQAAMFRRTLSGGKVRAIISMTDCDEADYSFSDIERIGREMSDADFKKLETAVSPSDIADILFTSGTTGIPKMVMISQYSRLNMGRLLAQNLAATENDKFLNVLPMFHCFSLGPNLTAAMASGAAVHIPDSRHTSDIIKAIRRGCTILSAVPTQFTVLLKRDDLTPEDCASLRTGIVAGAACSPTLFRQIEKTLGVTLVSSLGMTEGSAGVTTASLDDDLETRCVTVGRVQEGLEGKIIDTNTGLPVPDGERGEFCVRGFSIMQGYYNEPELTAKAIDADGWLHSGDLAWRDERGIIHLAGRLKELIIRCGENICPGEIENIIMEHDAVSACKVAATPDKIFGEEVCAVIVPKKGRSVTNRELIDFMLGKTETNRIPRYYIYLDALPVNDVGKPDLNAIKEIAAAAEGTEKETIK